MIPPPPHRIDNPRAIFVYVIMIASRSDTEMLRERRSIPSIVSYCSVGIRAITINFTPHTLDVLCVHDIWAAHNNIFYRTAHLQQLTVIPTAAVPSFIGVMRITQRSIGVIICSVPKQKNISIPLIYRSSKYSAPVVSHWAGQNELCAFPPPIIIIRSICFSA